MFTADDGEALTAEALKSVMGVFHRALKQSDSHAAHVLNALHNKSRLEVRTPAQRTSRISPPPPKAVGLSVWVVPHVYDRLSRKWRGTGKRADWNNC